MKKNINREFCFEEYFNEQKEYGWFNLYEYIDETKTTKMVLDFYNRQLILYSLEHNETIVNVGMKFIEYFSISSFCDESQNWYIKMNGYKGENWLSISFFDYEREGYKTFRGFHTVISKEKRQSLLDNMVVEFYGNANKNFL
jgi:hypothetical protein